MDQSLSPVSLIPHSAPRVRSSAPTSRSQPTLIPGAGLIACLDSLAAVAGVVAVWVSLNLSSLPGGVDSFLSARITVKNVLLLILLATAWPVGLPPLRSLRGSTSRHFGSEAGRLVAATTAGSGLALAFPLTSTTGTVTVWQTCRISGWLAHPLSAGANRQASRGSCAPSSRAPSADYRHWSSGPARLQRSPA